MIPAGRYSIGREGAEAAVLEIREGEYHEGYAGTTDLPFTDPEPSETITFFEPDGTERTLTWEPGERDVGIPGHWEPDDEWLGLKHEIRELEEENLSLRGAVTMLQGMSDRQSGTLGGECDVLEPAALCAIAEIAQELLRARVWHKIPMRSYHEGYGILLEKVQKLWDAVRFDDPPMQVREEAIQVGAMAVRFLTDLCLGARNNCQADDGAVSRPRSWWQKCRRRFYGWLRR